MIKNIQVFSKKNRCMTLLSLLYIFVETTAFIFLTNVFSKSLDLNTLSQYEKFGYASASIGMSLFALFFTAKYFTKSASYWTSFVLTFPLLYMISSWALYETIHKIPDVVPDNKKSHALSSSIRLLNDPSIYKGFSFYLSDNTAVSKSEISHYVNEYAFSNKVIQRFYIKGLINSREFTKFYKIAAMKLDKETWRNNESYLKSKRFFLFSDTNPYLIGSIGHMDMSMSYVYSLNPFTYARSIERIIYSTINGDVGKVVHPDAMQRLKKNLFKNLFSNKLNFTMANIYDRSDIMIMMQNRMVWQEMASVYDFIPINAPPPENDDILESIRAHYSYHYLDKYSSGATFNWYDDKPFDDPGYKQVLMSIAPFFFDENGGAVITLSNLRDKDFVHQAVKNLNLRLPVKLKKNWVDYRRASIERLSAPGTNWSKNRLEAETHSDMVRVSVVLPVMGLFSLILLITNIVQTSRGSKKLSSACVGMVILAFVLSETPVSRFMLSISDMVSVNESQIFLN